jgi:hypothetical protein
MSPRRPQLHAYEFSKSVQMSTWSAENTICLLHCVRGSQPMCLCTVRVLGGGEVLEGSCWSGSQGAGFLCVCKHVMCQSVCGGG